MTVKRQWMLALMLSAALSVFVNSIVFSALINRYFIDYSTENYKKHVAQVVAFSTDALSTGGYSRAQLEMQLEEADIGGVREAGPVLRILAAESGLTERRGEIVEPALGHALDHRIDRDVVLRLEQRAVDHVRLVLARHHMEQRAQTLAGVGHFLQRTEQRFLLDVLPAFERGHELVFDHADARERGGGAGWVARVEAAVGELVLQRFLLGFERADALGQLLEFALILVAQLLFR